MSDGETFDEQDRAAHTGLLRQLREGLVLGEEVPARLLEGAREALAWRDPDVALGELVSSAPPVGVRGQGGHYVFAGPGGWHLVLELQRADGQVVATGQVTPAIRAVVAWESQDGISEPVDIGQGGFFELEGVPRGPVRFRVDAERSSVIHTDWLTI
jgi:hypothetical protein